MLQSEIYEIESLRKKKMIADLTSVSLKFFNIEPHVQLLLVFEISMNNLGRINVNVLEQTWD